MRQTKWMRKLPGPGSRLRAWCGLGLGLAAVWTLAFVVLPQGQRLPLVAPVMRVLAEAQIDAGAYWYTQSEETAQAERYVRHALRAIERRR